MKKKIVLPPLFVLVSFLVGATPKANKSGSLKETSYNPKNDSIEYNLNFDSCYWLQKIPVIDFISHTDSANKPKDDKDTVSYDISWHGRQWVKYTSDDGSGFIRTGGSRTWRNMNPGALRHGDFSKQYGACGSAGGFAVFPTEEYGMNALRALLKSDKYANLTIASAVYKYAPPSDNNDINSYQQKLSRMTGLKLNKKLCQLTSEELDRVVFAIKEIEGWKTGKNEAFKAADSVKLTALERTNFLKYRNLKQKTL